MGLITIASGQSFTGKFGVAFTSATLTLNDGPATSWSVTPRGDTVTTPSPTFPSGSNNFSGGVLLSDGRVFCVPLDSTTATIYNPVTGTATTAGGVWGATGFRGGVLLQDGRVLCIPTTSTGIAKIYNPVTNTTTTPTTFPAWWFAEGNPGTLLPDGRVFIVPYSITTARIYDPVTNTLTTPSGTYPGLQGFSGGVLLPDGRVFCVPYNSTTARIYDPVNDTLTTPSGTYPGVLPFYGGVLLSDGRVFIVPRNNTEISRGNGGTQALGLARIYDPVNDTLTTPSAIFPCCSTFSGGVLMPNGKVFCVPYYSTTARIWSVTGLPAGLSLNTTTGAITGTPTEKGSFTASFTATGGGVTSAPSSVAFTITDGVPIITASQTASGTVGTAFSKTFSLTDSANRSVTSWAATGLPSWATLDTTTGAITGTPQDSGSTTISLTATGPGGTSAATTATISIAVGSPIIVAGQSFTGKVGVAFTSATLTLDDALDRPATSWSVTGLPAGLSLNTTTGAITGTPTAEGSFTASFTATGGGGTSAASSVAFTISTVAVALIIVSGESKVTLKSGNVSCGCCCVPSWSPWIPDVSAVCSGQSFIQTRSDSNNCFVDQSQSAVGTKNCPSGTEPCCVGSTTVFLDAPATGCCSTPTYGSVYYSQNPYSTDAVICVTGATNDDIVINGSVYQDGVFSGCWAQYGIGSCGNLNCAHGFTYSAKVGPNEITSFQCRNNCAEGGANINICYQPM